MRISPQAIIPVAILAILSAGCHRNSLTGVYQARGFIQFQGSNPRMEFFADGRVKRSNDQGIVLMDTYAVSNGTVTVTSASPMGNHILEFRIGQDRLVLSSGETFYKQGTTSVNGENARPNPAITPIDADRAEALKRAEAKWNEIWVQNADTWIAKRKDYPYLVEIKGRRVEVTPEPVSEIDRLNGIQWQGIVVMSCTAERKFAFRSSEGTISGLSDPYQAGWNDWSKPEDAAAGYRFRKKNDQWALLERATFDAGSLRGEMVRPRAEDLVAAGIKTTSQDSSEDIAFDKQRKNFLFWLKTYFAKGKSHKGEQTGGYHAGSVPYTFTFTMTADPVIQMQGSRDSKVKFKAFGKLHWHGLFNNGRGTPAQSSFYVDEDRVELRSEEIDLSKTPFNCMFKWFFVDPTGRVRSTSAYSSVMRGCGFQKNEYTLDPVVAATGGICPDSESVTSTVQLNDTEKDTASSRTAADTMPTPAVLAGERFPETRTRELSAAEVQTWSKSQLQYAINEIFARHGVAFGDHSAAKWFAQFPWYHPRPKANFDDIERDMSQLERQNLLLLAEYRSAKADLANRSPVKGRNQTSQKLQRTPNSVGRKILESILQGVVNGLQNNR